MASEIRLMKVYNTKKGKLRAKVSYVGRVHTLKLNGGKTPRCTVISMPVGWTSFEVQAISNDGIDQSVTIRLLNETKPLVRLDLTQSEFI